MDRMKAIRKLGDREPIRVTVTYPEAYNLAAVPIKFWMAEKILGQAGTATDITPAGSTAQTVWQLSYAPDADDFDTKGAYFAEFEADFGNGQKRYYPRDSDLIVEVTDHPATG